MPEVLHASERIQGGQPARRPGSQLPSQGSPPGSQPAGKAGSQASRPGRQGGRRAGGQLADAQEQKAKASAAKDSGAVVALAGRARGRVSEVSAPDRIRTETLELGTLEEARLEVGTG